VGPRRRTAKIAFLGPQLVKYRQTDVAAVQLAQVGVAPARPSHGQQLVPSMAIGSMAEMLTIGIRFVQSKISIPKVFQIQSHFTEELLTLVHDLSLILMAGGSCHEGS